MLCVGQLYVCVCLYRVVSRVGSIEESVDQSLEGYTRLSRQYMSIQSCP